jgi:hypothetical protein
MMENLKKLENSWREMDEFPALSKKLHHTTTNLTQKRMKEDMISSFVKKMAKPSLQAQHMLPNHKTSSKHLNCSVFAEWQMGQAIVQFLEGGNKEMPSLLEPFFSEMHNQEINCEKFLLFLKSEIPLTPLEQL